MKISYFLLQSIILVDFEIIMPAHSASMVIILSIILKWCELTATILFKLRSPFHFFCVPLLSDRFDHTACNLCEPFF